MTIVFRYVARTYLVALVAALAALTTLYLVVDFADRAKFYTGAGWLKAVVELYLCKAAVVGHQLAPAALALGATVAVSRLRRNGEITALRSLGRGPWALAVPVMALALAAALGLQAVEDSVVVPANYRAEQLTALRFHKWGDWGRYHFNRKWYRGKDGHVYHLGRIDDAGFRDVAIYELDDDFRLTRRIEASRIRPAEGQGWRLTEGVERRFLPDGSMKEERFSARVVELPDDLSEFRVKTGRPSQLRRRELPEQIAVRRKLGLPAVEWELAVQERRAYQLAGVPAAVLGAFLALRRGRRGHLSMAIGEGMMITVVLWAVSALSRTLALAGHLHPVVGGWLPTVVVTIAALVALRWAK